MLLPFRRAYCALFLIGLVLIGAGRSTVQAQDSVELVVSKERFQPDVLRVGKGETLRVRIRSSDEEHCFAIDELRIEKRVVPGRASVVELTPDRAGRFEFYCCLDGAPRGRLIVSD